MENEIVVNPSDRELREMERTLRLIANERICKGWFTANERLSAQHFADALESASHFPNHSR